MEDKVPELPPELYDELRRLATAYLRRERSGHTLQATAVVHEAYLRIARGDGAGFKDRTHFVATTAHVMRQILVDYARERNAAKRGGGYDRVTLTEACGLTAERPTDLVALDDALRDLATLDREKVEIVEMHFFGGLSLEEIATALGTSRRTVARQMQRARAWLYRELNRENSRDGSATLPSG